MAAYVLENTYCASDYCEVEAVGAVGTVGFDSPPVGLLPSATPQKGRITVEASPPSTVLPGGEFAMVAAIVLTTHAGDRIFSQVAIDPIYGVPPSLGRYVTLLDLDSITLTQGGSGSTLVTRVTSLELVGFTAIFDNSDGQWSQLVASEYVLCMSMSLYMILGPGVHVFSGRGEVQEVIIRRKTAAVRVGA